MTTHLESSGMIVVYTLRFNKLRDYWETDLNVVSSYLLVVHCLLFILFLLLLLYYFVLINLHICSNAPEFISYGIINITKQHFCGS